MAAAYDIIIEQGSTFTFSVTVQSVDLSIYTVRMQGRTGHGATSTAFSVSTATSGVSVALVGSDSVVTVTLGSVTTAAIDAPSKGVYDLEYSDEGGIGDPVVTRILEGSYYVTPEATR